MFVVSRVAFGGVVAALLVVFALRFREVTSALFIGFLAALFAMFLFECGRRLAARLPFSRRFWIAAILLASLGAVVLVGFLSGAAVASQVDALGEQVRPAIDAAQGFLSQYGWGRLVLSSVQGADFTQALPGLADVLGGFVFALVAFVVVLFAGVFISFEPRPYVAAVGWVARGQEQEVLDVLSSMRSTLFRWTVGRLASMGVVFVLTLVGLLVVGLPLAGLLALIAGLLSFIPNFGPIVSALLAVLVGFSVSPALALWVLVVFLAVQFVESNIVTPFIEHRAVHLPMGLLLLVQTFMGLVFGLLGLVVATPLLVVGIEAAKGYRELQQ